MLRISRNFPLHLGQGERAASNPSEREEVGPLGVSVIKHYRGNKKSKKTQGRFFSQFLLFAGTIWRGQIFVEFSKWSHFAVTNMIMSLI